MFPPKNLRTIVSCAALKYMRTALTILVALLAITLGPPLSSWSTSNAWAQNSGTTNVAVLNLEGTDASPELLDTLTSVLRNEAQQYAAYDIVNQSAINLSEVTLVLGCSSEDMPCLAEAARQIDAKILIYGEVNSVGQTYQVTIEIFDADRQKIVQRMVRTLSKNDSAEADTVVAFRQALQALFRNTDARQNAAQATFLQVESNIPGTEIKLNGELVGTAPIERADLSVGVYEIEAVREGYERWATRVKLTPGAEVSVLAYMVESSDGGSAEAPPAVARDAEENTRTAAPPPPDLGPARTNWGAWSAIGVGTAALAGSGVMAFLMHNTEKDVEALDQRFARGELARNAYLDERADLDSTGKNRQTAHIVLLSVGGASALAGVIWLLVDSGSAEPSTSHVRRDQFDIGLSPTGAWANWSW